MVDSLRRRLQNVYWVGGGSGSGKSTVARRIAAEHGLRVYDSDDAMARHAARTSPEDGPLLARFVAMDIDERWVNRSPDEMLDTFPWFRGEGFQSIVEDLLNLPTDPPVVVDGFRLLPHLVHSLLASPGKAVWLLPSPEFRQAAFERRRPSGMPWAFLDGTSDPNRGLRNLLERDRMFTDRVSTDARRLGLQVIEVGTDLTEDDLASLVAAALRL